MSHVRQQIRDAVVTALTGLTTTGTRVFKSRVYPFESGKLPALIVYTKSETSTNETMTRPRTQLRVLEVMVECYVMANTNFDNSIDTIAVEVEEALYSNITLGGKAKDINTVAFESDYSGDGEQVVGVGRFTVEVTYSTKENDLEVAV